MNTRIRFTLIALTVVVALLIGCASEVEVTHEASEARGQPAEEPPAGEPVVEPAAAPTAIPPVGDGEGQSDDYTLTSFPSRPNRLIVKNAELKLTVNDTDVAIDRTTQIAADSAGYIISSRVWYEEWLGENYKHASITIGVPVDQFERAMRRLRNLALRVVDESASGQDVTDEYVDLQSRLGNLEATRDRIREFLDQAQTIEESLRINEELAAIEEQIEEVQGRMNYLFDRAAYSTITIQIDPELPQPTPAPTPTPAPPIPPWTPSQTARQAGGTLSAILRVVTRLATETAIWLGIVVLPLLGPPALFVWLVLRWSNRRSRAKRQSP
ncbi:MAG: hypothetical protein DRJ03_10790 [Chloroflexi bacterium]|nr:MAG: hypothetical protein DRJ03_10790 [Chloroflexota bacterium]